MMLKSLLKNLIFQNIVFFLLPALIIVSATIYVYISEREKALATFSTHEEILIKIGKRTIESSFDVIKDDLVYLSLSRDLRLYLDGHKDVVTSDLVGNLQLLMQYRKSYDQIRWIDETGKEQIRLEHNNSQYKAVPLNELQNKKDRYYFSQTSKLDDGAVYVSPFDLNEDDGTIEIPYKPTIRFATPLIDTQGHRRGIFIINYLGAELIKRFDSTTASSYGVFMILNPEGYFLKGATHEDEWGFMRNREDLTLDNRYPDVWKRISREKNGQFQDQNGLWTFETVDLHGWKIVSFIPTETIFRGLHLKIKFLLTISGLLLLLIAVVGYFYSKKEETANRIRDIQSKTEGILLSVPDIIMQVDNQKRYVWANTQGLAFFGEDVIGKEASEYFEGKQDTYTNIHPMLTGETDSVYVESWQRRHDGEKRLLAWWCQNLKDEEGKIKGALSTARDITEERNAQQDIEKLSKALEQIDDIVYITDRFGMISYVNAAFCRHTGYPKEEVLRQNAKITKSGMHAKEFYKELWSVILSGEVYRNTVMNRKKNGDLYYEKKTITPLKDDHGVIVGFISTGKDVTEETMLNKEIERIATVDQLTGIYNRHKFEELFMIESERFRRFSQPLSLILIDIDHFKGVNDTYGHDVGDKVLVQLSAIVQESIRKIDIFARWGGEEFLLLCPGTDIENVRKLAEKIRQSVENTSFPVVGKITISLGLSGFHSDDSFNELFKRADQGLYYAKEHGRNQVAAIF